METIEGLVDDEECPACRGRFHGSWLRLVQARRGLPIRLLGAYTSSKPWRRRVRRTSRSDHSQRTRGLRRTSGCLPRADHIHLYLERRDRTDRAQDLVGPIRQGHRQGNNQRKFRFRGFIEFGCIFMQFYVVLTVMGVFVYRVEPVDLTIIVIVIIFIIIIILNHCYSSWSLRFDLSWDHGRCLLVGLSDSRGPDISPGQFPPYRSKPNLKITYIHTCMHTCIHIYIHAYTHRCMHTRIYAYNTYMHACIHIFMRTYTLKYSHIY